jgi:plastocyanin
MATTMTATHTRFARKPLAALGKLTLITLVGFAVLLIAFMILVIGEFVPPVLVVAAIPLIIAGVVATGWRWAPLLGTLVFSLLLALLVIGASEIVFTLSHPGGALFTFLLIVIPVLAIGFVASISATVQNYRSVERQSPRWLPGALMIVAGLVVGAVAVGSIPQPRDALGVSPETLAALPAVTLENFAPDKAVHVKAGETIALRLENPSGGAHAFVVDELGVNVYMPAGQNSLALFKATKPGTYTFYCTPHYNKATGEGMKGTLVVEP